MFFDWRTGSPLTELVMRICLFMASEKPWFGELLLWLAPVRLGTAKWLLTAKLAWLSRLCLAALKACVFGCALINCIMLPLVCILCGKFY